MSDDHTPPKLRAVSALPSLEPGNGGAYSRTEDRPPVEPDRPYPLPRSPAEVSANASVASLAYSMRASEWAGEAMAAAKAARDIVKEHGPDLRALESTVGALARAVGEVKEEMRQARFTLDRQGGDIRAIAEALDATRTVSSGALRIELPPEMKRSPTGSHFELEAHEAAKILDRIAGLEADNKKKDAKAALEAARAEGAEDALAKLRCETEIAAKKKHNEEAAAEAAEKKLRARISFGLKVGAVVVTAGLAAAGFVTQHFH